jgi:nicotinamide mononucleotide transporter
VDIDLTQLYSSNLELAGVILGVINVFLLTLARFPKIQWFNWPAAFASTAIYLYLFFEWDLFGNAILQIPFLIICATGLWTWRGQLLGSSHTRGDVEEIFTTYAPTRVFLLTTAVSVAAIAVAYPILVALNDLAPLWDGAILTLSLGASYLQLKKYVQSWYLWIAVDVIAVPLHLSTDHPATALLYFMYGTMCVLGLIAWHKESKVVRPHADMVTA